MMRDVPDNLSPPVIMAAPGFGGTGMDGAK